jgi:hypothetical protein
LPISVKPSLISTSFNAVQFLKTPFTSLCIPAMPTNLTLISLVGVVLSIPKNVTAASTIVFVRMPLVVGFDSPEKVTPPLTTLLVIFVPFSVKMSSTG